MHIDMNSYFASVEQQANPFLRGKAIGVSGKRQTRSIIATASREAKARGVKTAMSVFEATKLCPEMILIQCDPEKYNEITDRFFAIFREYAPCVEQFSIDEGFLDLTDCANDCIDAIIIAQKIRNRIKSECGEFITASIGIGPNKLIAKLASECKKPDGLTIIREDELPEKLNNFALQDFCGIGPQTAKHLEMLGIATVRALRACPLDLLVREFKSYGAWLYNASRGIDDSPVIDSDEAPKSIGHSYTFSRDISAPDEIKRNLLWIADKVSRRSREQGFSAKQISVRVRYSDFTEKMRIVRFDEPINDGKAISAISWKLISDFTNKNKAIRLLGISAGMLCTAKPQNSLFVKKQKLQKTIIALDLLEDRYGNGIWTRASLLGLKFLPRASGWREKNF